MNPQEHKHKVVRKEHKGNIVERNFLKRPVTKGVVGLAFSGKIRSRLPSKVDWRTFQEGERESHLRLAVMNKTVYFSLTSHGPAPLLLTFVKISPPSFLLSDCKIFLLNLQYINFLKLLLTLKKKNKKIFPF